MNFVKFLRTPFFREHLRGYFLRTLSNYAEKIEETIRYKSDPEGNVVNITAFSFTEREYKL